MEAEGRVNGVIDGHKSKNIESASVACACVGWGGGQGIRSR